jgi:hypothetical protein
VAAGAAVDQLPQAADVQQIQALRGFEGRAKLLRAQDLGEIEQRAARAGDRDAVNGGSVTGVERARDVAADAFDVVRRGRDHVNRSRWDGPQLQQGRRGAMAEHGLGSAGEHRGHPAGAERDARVADGVDAAPEAVQPALVRARVDRVVRVAEGQQLPRGDDAVLGRGQLCQTFVI